MLEKKFFCSSSVEVVVIFCSANDATEYSIPLMMLLSVLLDWIPGYRNIVAIFLSVIKVKGGKNGSDSVVAFGEYSQCF